MKFNSLGKTVGDSELPHLTADHGYARNLVDEAIYPLAAKIPRMTAAGPACKKLAYRRATIGLTTNSELALASETQTKRGAVDQVSHNDKSVLQSLQVALRRICRCLADTCMG